MFCTTSGRPATTGVATSLPVATLQLFADQLVAVATWFVSDDLDSPLVVLSANYHVCCWRSKASLCLELACTEALRKAESRGTRGQVFANLITNN